MYYVKFRTVAAISRIIRLADAHTTPASDGTILYSLFNGFESCQMGSLPLRHSARYTKQNAAFSDVLAFVRRAIWADKYFHNSSPEPTFRAQKRHKIQLFLSLVFMLDL